MRERRPKRADPRSVVWIQYQGRSFSAVVQDGTCFPVKAFKSVLGVENLYIGRYLIGPWTRLKDIAGAAPTTGQTGTQAAPFRVNGDAETSDLVASSYENYTAVLTPDFLPARDSVERLSVPRARMLCYFAMEGKLWRTDVNPWQPLPKKAVAAHFGLLEESFGTFLDVSLADLWRQRPQAGKSAATAIPVIGYYGPLQAGSVAGFHPSFVGDPSVYRKVQLTSFIGRGDTSAVFSALLLDANSNPVSSEELVVKLNYAGMEPGKNLSDEESALTEMEAQGFECPSLPKLLARGYLQVHNTDSVGNPPAHIIKPRGRPVSGLKVNGKQLCKAAFDLFLAIYHLSFINRRHRNVCRENVVYVGSSNQFVLVDFKMAAQGSGTANFDDCPRGYMNDSAWLIFTLAEMSNSDKQQRKWQACDIKLAADLLAREDACLGQFATHVEPFAEDSMRFFHRWLKRLAAACAIPDATLKALLLIPFEDIDG